MKKILILSIILVFGLVGAASAHQPRLVSENEITQIENPEISQAFYGELTGEADFYQINSEMPFDFYAGILVPDIEGIGTDISVEIIDETGERLFLLDGPHKEKWTKFYEPFAGDSYLKGPDANSAIGAKLPQGVYDIRVFSPDNEGKYVLVIGRKESFSPKDIIDTIKILPILQADFFGKPALFAYFNIIGLFLFVPVIVLIVGAAITVKKIKLNK